MYKIYWKDKLVAQTEGTKVIRLDEKYAPYGLFGNKTEVDIVKLFKWMEYRVFPEERIGADEILKELGLKDYNTIFVANKTQARLTGRDEYWIEFIYSDGGLYDTGEKNRNSY